MCVAGGALMYTANQDTSESRVYGCTVLIGLGVGMWIQASSSVAQAIVDPENVTSVIGFIILDQFLGNTTALAMNEAETRAQQLLPESSELEIQAAIGGVSGDLMQNFSPDLRT